jgi:DNA-directed RNA polymerase specialized sigma24 family protein
MKRTPYVTNKELLEEYEKYWKTGKVSDEMTRMLYLIARKIANSRNFYAYPYKADMVQEGVTHALFKGLPGFKKGMDNPFAYLSVIIIYKYIEYIKKEKRHMAINEALIEKLKVEILEEIDHRK